MTPDLSILGISKDLVKLMQAEKRGFQYGPEKICAKVAPIGEPEFNFTVTAEPSARVKYPWKDMQVGQVFCIRGRDKDRIRNSVSSSRAYAQKQTGFKFAVKTESYGISVRRTA